MKNREVLRNVQQFSQIGLRLVNYVEARLRRGHTAEAVDKWLDVEADIFLVEGLDMALTTLSSELGGGLERDHRIDPVKAIPLHGVLRSLISAMSTRRE